MLAPCYLAMLERRECASLMTVMEFNARPLSLHTGQPACLEQNTGITKPRRTSEAGQDLGRFHTKSICQGFR